MKQRWLDVCSEATICDSLQRLAELKTKIIAILNEEEQRIVGKAITAAVI